MAQKVVELENGSNSPSTTLQSENGNHTPAEKPHEVAPKKTRSRVPAYIVGGIILLGAVAGLIYWLYARQFETTDDAFVDGNIVSISPKISAHVTKVYITENQYVKKGDLLVELDAREIENKILEVQAQFKAAQAQSEKARANVSLTRKTTAGTVKQASANFETAKNNVEESKISADSKQNGVEQARNQVNTAEANWRQIQSEIPSAEAGLEQAKALVVSAQTRLEVARNDFDRSQQLFSKGDISKQGLERARKDFSEAEAGYVGSQKQVDIAAARVDSLRRQVDVAAAKINEAKTGVAAAQNEYRQSVAQVNSIQSQAGESAGRLIAADSMPQQLAVSESEVTAADAQIAQAQAALARAELELSYTKIFAPSDGFVSRKSVQEGQLVQPEQTLIAISQSNTGGNTDLWVIANFKETQIGRLHAGQSVDIYVDAYPGVVFRGKVDSFQAGTGSRFSVFPSENASGNFVKVVQRIPVKIVFEGEEADKLKLLVPGMSVVPRVKVR